LLLALILISTSWFACLPNRTQIPNDAAVMAICREWNPKQLADFGRIVELANRRGDPYQVRDGVLAMGAMLKRCFPDLFEKKD